jgi:hypothetical protein
MRAALAVGEFVFCIAVAHSAQPAESAAIHVSGTYELLICKSDCSLSDPKNGFTKAIVVLQDQPLTQDQARQIDEFYRTDGPPTGCYKLTHLEKVKSYVQIGDTSLTAWKLESGKLQFSLFRSPDAGYRVTLAIDGERVKGKGVSWGAGVAAPNYSDDVVIGRRVGPANIAVCRPAKS